MIDLMNLKIYEQEDVDAWNDFVDGAKNSHFFFNRSYMDYHKDRFQDFSLMIYNDKGKLISILPANISYDGGKKILVSHGGLTFGSFLTNEAMKVETMLEIFDAVKIFLRQQNFSALIYKCIPYIYWRYPSEEDKYALFINDAKLIRRDVSTTIYLPKKYTYSRDRKYRVGRSKKNNIAVIQSDRYEDFIGLENEILTKYHSARAVHSGQELQMLAECFPENMKLFTGEVEGTMLAGAVVFENGETVHTQYLANSDEGRQIGALDFVIDYLLNEVYPDKKFFDFGISNENAGRYLNRGLIAQKEGFGARAVVHDFYELKISGEENIVNCSENKKMGRGTRLVLLNVIRFLRLSIFTKIFFEMARYQSIAWRV